MGLTNEDIDKIGKLLDSKLEAKLDKKLDPFLKDVNKISDRVQAIERENRSRDIIIYGMPESSEKDDMNDNLTAMDKLCALIGVDKVHVEDIFRLRKKVAGKHIQLLVKLISIIDKRKTLKNAQKLRGLKEKI